MNTLQIPQQIVNRMNSYNVDRRNNQEARQERIIQNHLLQEIIKDLSLDLEG